MGRLRRRGGGARVEIGVACMIWYGMVRGLVDYSHRAGICRCVLGCGSDRFRVRAVEITNKTSAVLSKHCILRNAC